ncbi:hypothetical protein [Aquimarina sp. AU474]|uniref:hypothetical protein n=1 Tax=Aquimarina sp. AU474 TaxID=2108529 RepID=UPI0013579992|nr:hypothetical protein [Aquimarina sp. AU474]
MILKKDCTKTRLLLSIGIACLFILSSCHSYRSMDLSTDEIVLNKKYKVTTQDLDQEKIKILKITDYGITTILDKKQKHIPFSEIKEIKNRKFSFIKTFVILPVSYAATGVGLVYLSLAMR